MARIRQIKPEFYLDDELAKCSRDSRLLFTGLWVIADRRGRLEDRPAKIKAQVFPYDNDLSISNIDNLLGELMSGAFIIRYINSGRKLIQIRTFEKHQHCHIKEPDSQLPGPESSGSEAHHSPSKTEQAPDKPGASTVQEPGKHRSSPAASGVLYLDNGVMEYGYRASPVQEPGKPGATAGKKRQPTHSNSDHSKHQKSTPVPEQFDLTDGLKEWASKTVPDLNVEAETEKFLDHHRSKGASFSDWNAAWRKWMRNAAEWGQARNNGQRGPATDWDKLIAEEEKRLQEQETTHDLGKVAKGNK